MVNNTTTTFLGGISGAAAQIRPYLPMSTHLLLSALFPIYTGAHASLTRPSSAAAPARSKRKQKATTSSDSELSGEDDDEDSEHEEESLAGKMEGLAPSDALLFPLMAGCTLAGLYVIIKWAGAAILNKVLGWYFSGMACFSVAKMLNDGVRVLGDVCWLRFYAEGGRVWMVQSRNREVHCISGSEGREATAGKDEVRTNPLPGRMGALKLSKVTTDLLWNARELLGRQYQIRLRIKKVCNVKAQLSLRTLVSTSAAVGIVLYATFINTPWYLTNLQGFAFSYTALQLLSPTTFATGSLVLAALFFYDIYFVFYTPLMVTVATNLDVPIKLLFPRPEEEGKVSSLAMLGLGDVVIPGIMVGLSLRFDLYLHYLRKQKQFKVADASTDSTEKATYIPVAHRWGDRLWTLTSDVARDTSEHAAVQISGRSADPVSSFYAAITSFKKTYFHASIIGYVLGMSTTLGIMHVFKHAQPALLYLVPGVLGSIWLTAWVQGDLKTMWEYTEMVEEEEDNTGQKKSSAEAGKSETKKNASSQQDEPSGQAPDKADESWLSRFFGESIFGAKKNERYSKKLEDSVKKTFTADEGGDRKAGEALQSAGSFHFSMERVTPKTKKAKKTSGRSDVDLGTITTEDGKRRSGRLARRSASDSESEDTVLVHKADAASFMDTSTKGGAKGKSSGVEL